MSQDSPEPMPPNPYTVQAQDPTSVTQNGPPQGDAMGGMIPYKNPAALTAYYLGLFSLFPLLGLFLAIPAFILGIMGLRARRRNPEVKGSIHAWIGVVMGGIFTVVWGLMAVGILIAVIADQ